MFQIEAHKEDSKLFIVEGVISDLHFSIGKENLLQKVSSNYKAQSVVTGLGASLGDLYGQVAGAASLVMYDGDDTENFLCLFNDHVMCGTFGGASKLPVGKVVKAVVEKRDDLWVARAIMYESDGLLWITYPLGCKAERNANLKITWWGFWFQFLCMFIVGWAVAGFGTEKFWELMTISFFGMGLILLVMVLWNSSTMNALAHPATQIFSELGFANPESVNLNRYRYSTAHDELLLPGDAEANHSNIYSFGAAMKDGKLKFRT
ncbi:hypothetical protein [Pseudoduganella albidiflava]|uniref:Uncharacterized protein n=1 Tax=Pseudoduganella albidiflava TaxID=321983 RepID=A0A411WVT2_9BURK|nr:hypothetical protein [Pseudoduganella albidiflava]QBI00712.1 hypothetical protein EYF70_07485 [Pseudoduganella albidiflava]GGY31189.1 hypothetical protein GCM10007387_11490 [Pseudoduganella albidiflava]